MSSDTSRTYRRPHLGRMRRAALTAVAVVVGAIVLSGCVVIQSESAVQANVIGNSVTVTTVLCREQRVLRSAVQQPGEPEPVRGSRRDGPASRRLPDSCRRDGSTDHRVQRPLGRRERQPDHGADHVHPEPVVLVGPRVAPAARPHRAVGRLRVADAELHARRGRRRSRLHRASAFPAGFAGPFNWRTVVGFRSKPFVDTGQPVTCPGPFPGVSYPAPALTALPSVCVDYPDLATINGPPSSLATGDLAITPPTGKVAAGGSASLAFVAVLTGGNPTAGAFSAAVSTTVPGVTPTITPASFTPGPNSQNPLTVSFSVPASTPVGTYDVTVTATVSGQARSATGHITVTPSAKALAAAAAKLTSKLKTTTLKAARKTGIALTLTLSKKSAISLVGIQTKPKVSVTVKKTLKAGKKTIVLIKSKKFHKGKVTITFKGGGLTKVFVTTLK